MPITLLVPPDYLSEVVDLIDHMGWGVHNMDNAQLECAERVWFQVGTEPDYVVIDTTPTWDVMYAIRFADRDDDAQVMVDALNDYISRKYTAKTVDLHFTIGDNPNRLSGRLMMFYTPDDSGFNKSIGHVYHDLDGWWKVHTN